MIRRLPLEILKTRAAFLRDIRLFFKQKNYLEVETPLLNPTGGLDPFLDPIRIERSGVKKSVQAKPTPDHSYLITSPEYNLKTILTDSQQSIFQIAHCFREGDSGDLHSEEFMMLEWYKVGADEKIVMAELFELIKILSQNDYSQVAVDNYQQRSVASLFEEFCNCSMERSALQEAVERYRLVGVGEEPTKLRYDELFFTLFLNRIENHLGQEHPLFIYNYPPELAALAQVKNGAARRFELYWQGIELANGFFELTDSSEQRHRFQEENRLRSILGKEEMELPEQFLGALSENHPQSVGVAMGLDRLLMLLLGAEKLSDVSPFI